MLNELYLNLKSNLIEEIELSWNNLSELSYLELNLESNLINRVVENGLSNLSLLSYLELNLKDNYIDNTGFEPLLNNIKLINEDCEIILNVIWNNIVLVN